MSFHLSCACCNDLMGGAFSRRGFMTGAAASAAASAIAPYAAFAAEGRMQSSAAGLTVSAYCRRTESLVRPRSSTSRRSRRSKQTASGVST